MNLQEYYQLAIKNKFAIGAFNFYNMESMKAILNAASKKNAPVIIAVSESALNYFGDEYLKNAIKSARKVYSCPFFVHLDHGKNLDVIKRAIKIGFDSVMIDASAYPFEENVKRTLEVVKYAKPKGVQVEAELGTLSGVEDDVKCNKSLFTDPKEAKKFVELTGVDSLAIAIGTSHGVYKFAGEPKLQTDILKKIQKELPNFPLVLHGASSVNPETIAKINKLGGKLKDAKGVPEEILNQVATKYNICKINVDSDIRMQTTLSIKEYLKDNPTEIDPRKYLGKAMQDIEAVVAGKICNVFGYKCK